MASSIGPAGQSRPVDSILHAEAERWFASWRVGGESPWVSRPAEACVESAGLGVRAGLNGALCRDGTRSLAGLAARRLAVQSRPSRCSWGQLTLNWAWSFLFFSLQSPRLALLDIVCCGCGSWRRAELSP